MHYKEQFIKHMIDNYVFNNPVKMFLKDNLYDMLNKLLDDINFHSTNSKNRGYHSEAFRYNIKINNKKRTIHFPNFFTYYAVTKEIAKRLPCENDNDLIPGNNQIHNRMKIDYRRRKLAAKNYRNWKKRDIRDLKFRYDVMSFFDISNFYSSIYTHCYEHLQLNKKLGFIDFHIRQLNTSKTKGILLGNALSIFCADKIMLHLCNQISDRLHAKKVKFDIGFFSDQFYIKHNFGSENTIKTVVSEVLHANYMEFFISEHKYTVLTLHDIMQNRNFDRAIEKLRNIFLFEIKKILCKTCNKMFDCNNSGSSTQIYKCSDCNTDNQDETDYIYKYQYDHSGNRLSHWLNTLVNYIDSTQIAENLKDSLLKVAFKFFASPINLHNLYNEYNSAFNDEKQENIEEINSNFLFLISRYPVIIYDLFQLSILEAIDFREIIKNDMKILCEKLYSYNVQDYELLYWFLKIIILKEKEIKPYEYDAITNLDNKILIAFLIRNAPELLSDIDILKQELPNIINDINNLYNDNWLIFYEYTLLTNKNNLPFKIQITDDKTQQEFINRPYKKSLVHAVEILVNKSFSFMSDSEDLSRINEILNDTKEFYTNRRWSLNSIQDMPNVLINLKSEYNKNQSAFDQIDF